MGKKRTNLEGVQLYNLVTKYSDYVDNSDDRDILIGYCILDALLNYHSKSNSEEEKLFEEVKSVYTNLKNTLDTIISTDTYTPLLVELKFDVDKKIHRETNTPSKILTNIIPTLIKKKNSMEYINCRRNYAAKSWQKILEKIPNKSI